MTNKTRVLFITLAFTLLLLLGTTKAAGSRETTPPPHATSTTPTLDHAQTVWSYALEWCESQGDPRAINPKDRDGTPSYGAYQFKPGTLESFAKLYGLFATTTVMSYEEQRATVDEMILHRQTIDWHQQFPDCVRKLGLPPA